MRIVIGFFAAMLAVLLVHQPIIWGFMKAGLGQPGTVVYDMSAFAGAPTAIANAFKSLGLAGFPRLFNSLFWGGLWGAAYALVQNRIPGPTLVKGLLYGLFMLIVANWVVIPLIRGTPLFAGMVPLRMAIGATINIGFCIGLAFIYSAFTRRA